MNSVILLATLLIELTLLIVYLDIRSIKKGLNDSDLPEMWKEQAS